MIFLKIVALINITLCDLIGYNRLGNNVRYHVWGRKRVLDPKNVADYLIRKKKQAIRKNIYMKHMITKIR